MEGSSELGAGFRALLAARDLTVADGRPLYAYRFTKEEYERNAELLRRHGRRALSDWNGSSLILMHVAEWFRRERAGGHWDWIRPLGSIGLDYGAGRTVSYAEVENAVRRGLSSWRRPLPQGGERLLAVVRESGFPVAAVREDPRISSWLKHSILCAERGFQIDQAVVSEAWRVSDRIAQALFEPAIDLCRAIVDLRLSIPAEVREKDPVAHLDAYQPDWREALPFDVEQEDVRSLVERMVRLREAGGAALDVERFLVRSKDGEWVPRASLVLEGRLDVRRVPTGIVQALAEARRLRIFPRPPFSEELVAVAAIETFEEDEGPVHEVRAFVTRFDAELALEMEARLFAQSGQTTVAEFVPAGGQPLAGPVVAMELVEIDDAQQPTRLRAIGCSSGQTSKPALVLAVRPELSASLQFSEPAQVVGTCRSSGRSLLLFSGAATLDHEGIRWRWRTSAERDLDTRPILVGDLVPNVRETAYLGTPRLWVEKDGHVVAPRLAALHWRPTGRGPWRPLQGAGPRGAIDLAVIEDGELRHSISTHVVPSDMKIEFNRTRRELRISGLNASMVGASAARPLAVRREGDTQVIDLGPPSGTPMVTIRARWETEVALTLADPSYELRLIDEKDKLVGTRAVFALDGLSGRRILATREVSLCMELRAVDAPRLVISRPVTGDVPLSALRDTIRQLLGRSARLDSSVLLYALGASEHVAEVRWYSDDVNPFVLSERNGPFAALAAIQALDLRAVSLLDPGAGTCCVTAPATEAAMSHELGPLLPNGPWLLFGNRQSGEILRPRILPAARALSGAGTPLVRAIVTDSFDRRARAFDDAFAQPSLLPREDVRRLIDLAALARREHIPASGIDALRALERAPSAAVHVLANCEDIEERAALLDLQRDLPLLWSATSIESWRDAFGARFKYVRSELLAVGIDLDASRLATKPLQEITDMRPELAGHARAVFLSMAASSVSGGKPIDGTSGAFLRSARLVKARAEIDRLITRHQEGDAPPYSFLSDRTSAAHRARWEPYLPAFADLIAAPFAVAEHAVGMRLMPAQELARCRDAALYDPEYFEVIVPMRINELFNAWAQTSELSA